MKKFKYFMTAALAMVFAFPVAAKTVAYAEETAAPAEEYTVEIAPENNLAVSKYDWLTDKVGAGDPQVSEEGIRLENFTNGNSVYALYQTNRFSNFKYSMYANINLTRPDELGYDLGNDVSYSNFYISFMIDAAEPSAAFACPWNGNKAYFSVCFETLSYQGTTGTKTQLYLNESFVGNGAARAVVAEANNVNWNDGEYHWYEFSIENYEEEGTYRGSPITYTGKHFKFYFDGEFIFEHKQRDQKVTYTDTATGEPAILEDANFSGTSGYLGLWPSSSFPANALTEETDCYVQIDKMQITSWDNGNTAPYVQCPTPDFPLTEKVFSPAASYEVGEPIELKLADLFSYEGDEKLTYAVTCEGETLGKMNNGYWIWTPETAGTYLVDVKATVGDKEAINYLTIRVVDGVKPPVVSDSVSESVVDTTEEKSGCGSSVAGVCFVLLPMAVGLVALRKREN